MKRPSLTTARNLTIQYGTSYEKANISDKSLNTRINKALKGDPRFQYLLGKGDSVNKKEITEFKNPTIENSNAKKFNINKRFEFLEIIVSMVGNGITPSAIITGDGGLGKSHTVNHTLKSEGIDYRVIKGAASAKGLYRYLYENSDSTIIFDDCDDVLKDPVALNILKSALDSYEVREITWLKEIKDDDLPNSFFFTGNIIFISNLKTDKMNEALLTRSLVVNLDMTWEDKFERMKFASDVIAKEENTTQQVALEVLNFLYEIKNQLRQFNFRTFKQAIKLYLKETSKGRDWKEMIEFTLCF
jgi:hypothetical protein